MVRQIRNLTVFVPIRRQGRSQENQRTLHSGSDFRQHLGYHTQPRIHRSAGDRNFIPVAKPAHPHIAENRWKRYFVQTIPIMLRPNRTKTLKTLDTASSLAVFPSLTKAASRARPPEPALNISAKQIADDYFNPTCFLASLQRELTFASFFLRQSCNRPSPAGTSLQNLSKSSAHSLTTYDSAATARSNCAAAS